MTKLEYNNCQEQIVYHVYEEITCFIVLIFMIVYPLEIKIILKLV